MLPMIKLGGLVARTLTKPMARVVKSRSKVHPLLRVICEKLGQQQHRLSIKLHMGFRGIANYNIKPLSSDQAVEQGADLMGELLIFSVALGVASFEYSRSAANARNKEATHKELQLQEEREMETRFARLESQVVKLEKRLTELARIKDSEMGTRLELVVAETERQNKIKTIAHHTSSGASNIKRGAQQSDQNVHVGIDIDENLAAKITSSAAKLWTSTSNALARLFK
ncbi:hypothetical protein CCR75_008249 [Bremia lactucae]|uniref:OPA3-like protein n=1 Tax=Bremia lactucae TaxID=4779 RepID=A0A976IGR8_BRELC|nr:hypothetical protein CCR75_008249 [Bremia lactucae]